MKTWLLDLRNEPAYTVVHVQSIVWDKVCAVVAAAENRYGDNPADNWHKNDYLDTLLTELRDLVER